MNAADKRAFLELLTDTFAAYGKEPPAGTMLKAWWSNLEPYPLRVVALALSAYRDEVGEFAPVPAGIAKRCKVMDGRPTADEAWAMALTSRSELDTVVWTTEAAQAFSRCMPVLQTGDKVGARRAFIDSYERLVTEARNAGRAAAWLVSEGWDPEKRQIAVARAQAAGLLPAPPEHLKLSAPAGTEPAGAEPCPEGLKQVKAMLAEMQDGWAKAAARREAEKEAERAALAQRKQDIAAKVSQYGRDDA
jgi:hypothetical protein